LYYAWMESSQYQGTLGKMALGLTVTDLQGRRVTFARASGRFFAKIITGLIPLAIGYIMAGFTEKKQALHDMIASCLVLRKT
ncbi:MAG: RDD family protein, partial [Candidatus Acidiferrales bacterium]